MGIYNALFTGASGLQAFGESVRVIGDNIANVNSLGFKSSNVQFANVLSQTIGVTKANIANQVGGGVKIGQITHDSRQGSVKNTTSATDMAINGNGMFALKDPASGQTFYTRAGSFILDKSSNLIDGQGNVVQGWKTDAAGLATGNVANITFANSSSQAAATTKVTAGVTIDSSSLAIPATTAFDPADPATYSYKTQINTYDSLGNTHPVNIYYSKTASNVWQWHAGVNSIDLVGKANANDTGEPLIVGPNARNVGTPALTTATVAGTTATPGIGAGAQISGTTTFDTAVTINGTTVAAGTAVGATALGGAVIVDTAGIVAAAGSVNVTKGNVLLKAALPATATFATGANVSKSFPAGTQIAAGSTFNQPVTIDGTTYAANTSIGATALTVATSFSTTATTALTLTGGSIKVPNNNLVFGGSGQLQVETGAPTTFPWNSATAGPITFDFGNATMVDAQGLTGAGTNGTTQMAGAFATRQMTGDGYASGFLDKLDTDSTGRIYGVFTNGQRRPMFQVALAKFPNDVVLTQVGNSLQQETIASGSPILEKPGNGGMGTITPFGLEQSNVDLGTEFVKLIVSQRGYEANSKTILTTDQMLSSLMQLKR